MEDDPAEPAANLTAGRYLCFVVGDWEQGVPYLALGSDPGLKAVAIKELRGAASADEQAAIGDMWWDLAETKRGRERDSLRLRAGSWCRQAVPNLAGGLTGLKVKQRLQEIGRLGREIPAARPTPAATATVGEQGLQNGDFRNRLEGWTVEGSQTTFFVFAHGDKMAVTSWGVRKDAETGRLSQTFTVPRNARTLRFFVHGGYDPASLYVALRRGDELIGRVTAKNDNTPFEVRWDITSARGAAVTLEVVDQNQNPWGFIAVHGFRIE